MWDISMKERMIVIGYFNLIHLLGIEKQPKAHVQMSYRIIKILYFLALLTSTDWAIDVDGIFGLQASGFTHGIMLEESP